MHTALQDVRYSARQLIKNPGFTLTAVISLALGIGASTAVFTVIYAALLHPYPYPAADRIVQITTQSLAGPGDPIYLNGTQIQTLRQSPVVESVSGNRLAPCRMNSRQPFPWSFLLGPAIGSANGLLLQRKYLPASGRYVPRAG